MTAVSGAGTDHTEHKLRHWAQQMVEFHVDMQASFNAGTGPDGAALFPEHGPYAQLSFRELLKVVKHLAWYVRM